MKLLKLLGISSLSLGAACLFGFGTPLMSSWWGVEPAMAQESERKRIVVLDFDFGDTTNVWWSSYRGTGAARGISEMMVNQLVSDGAYSIVDSSQVGQDRWYRTNVSEAVEIGRELGIDAIIMGTVTRFDVDEDEVCVRVAFVRSCNEETKATVQINARLINTESGEIVATAQGAGEATDNDASGSVSGIGGGSSNDSEEEALLGAAVDQAVNELVEEILDSAERL